MAQTNDLNQQMFYALEVSEKSKIPFLFISSPGVGKSTTVEIWSKLKGYDLEILRGNSTSETEIMGYDVYSGDITEDSAKHLIPHWASRIFKNAEEGRKSVLFLDEITGCSQQVQQALLHLIFERKIHDRSIPDSCLIIAAGNYQQSLGNEFTLLPPLMNRFCIYNLFPTLEDYDSFLSEYSGSIMGEKPKSLLEKLSETFKSLGVVDNTLDEESYNKIGEYFQRSIKETINSLAKAGEKPFDPKITDMQDIFSATENDVSLKGFISPRSAHYLLKISLTVYEIFGKVGIQSSNFKKMIEGLCGIALSRKNDTVVPTTVTTNFYNNFIQVLPSIDKLNNNKIKKYEEFFNNIISNAGTSLKVELKPEEIVIINNKFTELKNDVDIKDVSCPIEGATLSSLCDLLKFNSNKIISLKVKADSNISQILTEEKVTGMITKWNSLSEIFLNIKKMISSSSYHPDVIKKVNTIEEKLVDDGMKLNSYVKLVDSNSPGFVNICPEIKNKY